MSEQLATQPTETTPSPQRMTYEEWQQHDHEGGLSEWIHGEVISMPPPSILHQRLVIFLTTLLTLFVQMHRLGVVLTAPVAMRATLDGNAREPDVLFVATEHTDRLTYRELSGPADLVIEVVSDESVSRDRTDKFYEYQEAGVREYWIIDPRPGKERVDFYILDTKQRYQPVPVPEDNIYHSTVLAGLWINITWLWEAEPRALVALGQVVGIEQLVSTIQKSSPSS
ncbi:MAG: Uma2 family endonuclease [Chloroflexota bacterium]